MPPATPARSAQPVMVVPKEVSVISVVVSALRAYAPTAPARPAQPVLVVPKQGISSDMSVVVSAF